VDNARYGDHTTAVEWIVAARTCGASDQAFATLDALCDRLVARYPARRAFRAYVRAEELAKSLAELRRDTVLCGCGRISPRATTEVIGGERLCQVCAIGHHEAQADLLVRQYEREVMHLA
jgi:hypothetical protein